MKTFGSRAEVFHGTAKKTSGGLEKRDLLKNKHGEIVSRKKHLTAKKEKRLEKAGYFTKKGEFGSFRKSAKASSRRSSSKKGGQALGGDLSPAAFPQADSANAATASTL
jgi:hypothetical protein